MVKINLQRFAEADGEEDATPKQKLGKVWTDDYVAQLREEAKNHRIAKKQYESMLRKIMSLKDDEEINEDKVKRYTESQNAILNANVTKANQRLIAAEIKGLAGYDQKLVDRLIDRTKLSVAEDGSVVGLADAMKLLEAEFPQVKVGKPAPSAPQTPPPGSANPPPNDISEMGQLEAAHADAMKAGKTAEAISLKNRMFELSRKTV